MPSIDKERIVAIEIFMDDGSSIRLTSQEDFGVIIVDRQVDKPPEDTNGTNELATTGRKRRTNASEKSG